MNRLARLILFRATTVLAFSFTTHLVQAADKPVDATTVVGHWVLQDAKTEDTEVKRQLADQKLEMTFKSDKTVLVSVTEKNANPQTRTATYRIVDGQIIIKAENEPEDSVKAVIREGKLILLPPNGPVAEFIFSKAAK